MFIEDTKMMDGQERRISDVTPDAKLLMASISILRMRISEVFLRNRKSSFSGSLK